MSRSKAEIQADIRELKARMKAQGIRVFSCFNGGHSNDSYAANARLFKLKCELDDVKVVCHPTPSPGWEHCESDRARAKKNGFDI